VERESANIVKLYITNIQATDGGRYKCVRMQPAGGRSEEKTVSLAIYSQSLDISTALLLLFV